MKNIVSSTNYCYPFLAEKTAQAIAKSYHIDMTLCVNHYKDAYILPAKSFGSNLVGGCVDAGGRFLWDSAVPDFMGYPYEFDSTKTEMEEVCIYMGYMFYCYGHMLGDCLRWAWFAQTDECKELIKKGAKFVCISNEPLQTYQKELLGLAGVDKIHCISHVTKVRHLYMPVPSIRTEREQNYYSDAFNDTINHMITNAYKLCRRKFYDKIYLTRRFWSRGATYGEKHVERFFVRMGYSIVSPQKFTIAEQIVMLNQAHEVAATEDSLSHSMIFCKPSTSCYILRKNLHVNKYQLFINQMRQLNATYIDCSLSVFVDPNQWWAGPFFIYPNNYMQLCFSPPPPVC